MQPLIPTQPSAIQAYFSHSYRADDRSVNLFFWRLFSEHGFFFTVDPKSGRTFVPHLERMLRHSDCFIAVVTRRLELVRTIGSVPLMQPQVIWNYSPYIQLENRLACRSSKPRLIFVESGLDANLFGSPEEVHIFDRDILDKREALYSSWVADFAETVRDYKRYTDRFLQPTRKAGILIDSKQGANSPYQPEVIQLIKDALRAGGYAPYEITPDMSDDQDFIRFLSDLDVIVTEGRQPWIAPTALAFMHARFIPTIRVCHLNPGETRDSIQLPDFLNSYRIGDIDPLVTWRTLDELALEIVQHMQKFQQSRTLLDTLDAGRRYFLSAGRRRARVFVSNAHSMNDLALELIKGFQTVNIQFFHYQATLRIGSAWQHELRRELNECDVFIALVNDDYHVSRWCQLEMDHAFERWRRREVTILPYVMPNAKLPDTIRDAIQCAFLSGNSHGEIVSGIVDTVDKLLIQLEQNQSTGNDSISRFGEALHRTVSMFDEMSTAELVDDFLHAFAKLIDIDIDANKQPQVERNLIWVRLGVKRVFAGLHNFPEDIPLILSSNASVDQQSIDAIKDWLIGQPTRIALMVVPANADQITNLREVLDQHVCKLHACDIIVLSHDDLLEIMRDPEPGTVLRHAVLEQINLSNYAPFIVNGSTPDHMFFGRESELRTICENVRAASYAVIGGRRIGKTSLLTRLYRVRLPAVGFRTIYLDCSTIADHDSFYRTPLRESRPMLPGVENATFGELMEHGLLASYTRDRPLLLLLDEADKLVIADRQRSWKLFNRLRSMANEGRLQVVLGGERTLREALRDPGSPLFNFANEMLIGRLEYRAAEELILGPLEQLNISPDHPEAIVQRIYEFTSGHPNIIQRLCRRLISWLDEHHSRELSIGAVNQILDDPDFIRKDFFDTYFSRASTLEHLCALAMAGDHQLRTLTTIQEALERYEVNATLNQVDAALERLVDLRNILERTSDGYDFAVTAFPKIIARSRRLSDWIGLRREVFVHAGDIAPETAPPELQGRLW